jgi:hypothetical protein
LRVEPECKWFTMFADDIWLEMNARPEDWAVRDILTRSQYIDQSNSTDGTQIWPQIHRTTQLRALRWYSTIILLVWYVGMQARKILGGEPKKSFPNSKLFFFRFWFVQRLEHHNDEPPQLHIAPRILL